MPREWNCPGLLAGFWLNLCRFRPLREGENMNHWIDLLIVIPSWVGVFAILGVIVASVVS